MSLLSRLFKGLGLPTSFMRYSEGWPSLAPSFMPWGGGKRTVDVGDPIDYSMYLDSSLGQHMTYTPAPGATTSRKKNEIHLKFKRSKNGTVQCLLCIGSASSDTETLQVLIYSDDTLWILGGLTVWRKSVKTYKVFDGWYYLTISFDTPQAAAADRLKVYDESIGLLSSWTVNSAPAQNADTALFSNQVHHFFNNPNNSGAQTFDGYVAQAILVEDQNYGETGYVRISADTGQRVNKTFAGLYGARGCKLEFKDANDLGADTANTISHNLRNVGTAIGGMSGGAGVSSAFNGAVSGYAGSAYSPSNVAGYVAANAVGKDWGAGVTKKVTHFTMSSPTDAGFLATAAIATGFKLQGSNDGADDNASWTDLYTGTTPAYSNASVIVSSGINTTTAYRYHRVVIQGNGANATYISELSFYETVSGVSKNLRTAGTNIGTFTGAGGLVAAFDGNTSQALASCAQAAGAAAGYNTAVIGKDWGAGVTKKITAVRLFAPNNGGFVGGTANALTFKIQGSIDGFAWDDLSAPITGPASGAGTVITVISEINTTTAYRYHRVNCNSNGSDNYYICEVEFYEAGSYGMNQWALQGGINSGSRTGDTPINNFCTMNPMNLNLGTLSKGCLTFTGSTSVYQVYGTIVIPASGKWFFEAQPLTTPNSTNGLMYGLASPTRPITSSLGTAGTYGIYASNQSAIITNGNSTWPGTSTLRSDYVNAMAIDVDAGKVWCGHWTGSAQVWLDPAGGSTGNPETGANPTFTFNPAGYFPMLQADSPNGYKISANFGQRPFAGVVPAGFKALCTANLPEVPIKNGRKHFDVKARLGDSVYPKTISGLLFHPGLTWIKNRSQGAMQHILQDRVRGYGATTILNSDRTNAENSDNVTQGYYGYVASSSADGYTLNKTGPNGELVNYTGWAYVDWLWNMGDTTVTNTQGSISSQVMANLVAGQGIMRWKGNNLHGATVGHGFGTPRLMVLAKNEDASTDWAVSHPSLSSGHKLYLNQNYNEQPVTSTSYGGIASISSTLLTLHNGSVSGLDVNGNLHDITALVFAEKEGHSKLGHWDGTGVNPGPWVYCGFKPRFILGKCATLNGSWWFIFDTVRNTVNPLNSILAPHLANSETTSVAFEVGVFGFRVVSTSTDYNGSGHRYIFYAVAECAGKYATAV